MSESHRYELHHIHIVCSNLAASERWCVDGVSAQLTELVQLR